MRRLLTLEECKSIQIEILDEIHSFCSSNGLRYSLAYGTLLGAVRHHGYIPWDDDIDIIMPRPDYELFIRNFSSDRNVVIDLDHTNSCIEGFVKVSRKGTVMKDLELGRELWGVNVDIFCADGASKEDLEERYENIVHLYSRLPRLCPFYKVVSSKKLFWFIKYIVKRIIYPYMCSCSGLKLAIRKKLEEQPFASSPLAGCYCGYGISEFVPREWFEEYTTLEFEGKPYSVLTHYDEYLRATFGDYMQLPPVEKRVTHHLYDSFIDE